LSVLQPEHYLKKKKCKKGYGPSFLGVREDLLFDGIHITPLVLNIYIYPHTYTYIYIYTD